MEKKLVNSFTFVLTSFYFLGIKNMIGQLMKASRYYNFLLAGEFKNV